MYLQEYKVERLYATMSVNQEAFASIILSINGLYTPSVLGIFTYLHVYSVLLAVISPE